MEKNVYKIIALIAFLVLTSVAIYVYRPIENKLARVTVIGDSQTKVAPDTAVITFSVVTQAKQAVDAQQENARKSEAVKKAVELVTVDSKAEIKTSDYRLNPERDYYSGRMPKILGYEIRNTVTVTIDKLDRVGSVIDAATKAGANSVEGIQFVIGEASPAQGDALAIATKQAMAKAESVAKSMNGKIVRVVQASEGGIPPQYEPDRFAAASSNLGMDMMSKRAPYSTPVQAGSLNIRSQVVLVVDIAI